MKKNCINLIYLISNLMLRVISNRNRRLWVFPKLHPSTVNTYRYFVYVHTEKKAVFLLTHSKHSRNWGCLSVWRAQSCARCQSTRVSHSSNNQRAVRLIYTLCVLTVRPQQSGISPSLNPTVHRVGRVYSHQMIIQRHWIAAGEMSVWEKCFKDANVVTLYYIHTRTIWSVTICFT